MAEDTVRVLVLSHMFPRGPADWSGIFVCEQVKALRAGGIDARVMTGNVKIVSRKSWRTASLYRHLFAEQPVRWRDVAGVPTLYFDFLAAWAWWGRFAAISYRHEVKRLAARVRATFPFDVIHAHTAFLDGGTGAWLARRFKLPFVLTEHTGPFSTLTAQPVMRRQTERAINRADAVIAVSETLRDDILARVQMRRPDHLQVLGNGVDPEIFRPNGQVPPDDGTIHALWIGGFLPVKQPLMLIQAFAAALREDPRLRLTIVGSGPLEAEIRAEIQRRGLGREVSLLPSAERSMVADYMRRHHFLVISSQSETFCLVAIEALACGRPVLSTRCGGPEETVRGAECGELVGNSAEDLAKGFVAMAARLTEFDAAALHDYARSHFGYPMIVDRLGAIYRRVLRDEGARA